VDTDTGLLILRLAVGLIFAAHGAQKAFGWWSGPGQDGWRAAMERMNLRPAAFWAAISTGVELFGGLLLAIGLFTPFAAAALVAQSIVIIGEVHWPKGFFNTKGGYEYPLTLGAVALALLLAGPGLDSVDAWLGFVYPGDVRLGLLVVGVIGAAMALVMPRAASDDSVAASR
jgi:putative oxidoreductase